MIDIRHVLVEYSFQIALAVGHKTDNKTQHEYDYEKQVTTLEQIHELKIKLAQDVSHLVQELAQDNKIYYRK